MPGARWFPGAQVNYAQHLLSHADASHAAGHPAMVFGDEQMLARGELREVSWPELRRQAASCAAAFKAMGVQRGDRVCAVMPNVPETIVVFLACASLGAIWSVCSPDMGPVAVLDRFRQIEPKLLVACDGYRYGGVAHDRGALLRQLLAELPSLQHVVLWRCLDAAADVQALADGSRAGARPARAAGAGRGLRARAAALRPSDVDRLFQRHHRVAQAHRARPRRHHARSAEAHRAAQRRRPQCQRRRPLPLVFQHRLDHVELPGRRAAGRQHHLHLRRQPGRAARCARLEHARGALPGWRAAASSAPARPSMRPA